MQESSLTTPSNRNTESKWLPSSGTPPLTNTENVVAMNDLNNTTFISAYPRVDRVYCDPPIPMQQIALLSFIPAKGATPDSDGVYGFSKIRGVYAHELEANSRAEFLIRNVDSYHTIYHTYVGRPFPLTNRATYSAETTEVDIRKKMSSSISEDVKQKRQDEISTMEDIKTREEQLLNEVKKEVEDSYEVYTTLRVKKAQITWTYLETLKKIEQMKTIIQKTRTEIAEIDELHPDYTLSYYAKYMEARRSAGFVDESANADNFMRYLVEDVQLDF